MARRRAGDDRHALRDLGAAWPEAPTVPSAPACASIIDVATATPGVEAEIVGSGGREPAEPFARHAHARPDLAKRSSVSSREPDRVEVGRIPAAARGRGRSTCTRCCTTNDRRCRWRATSDSPADRTSARCGATCRGSSRLTQRSFGVCISGEIDAADVVEHAVTSRVDRGRVADRRGDPSRRRRCVRRRRRSLR